MINTKVLDSYSLKHGKSFHRACFDDYRAMIASGSGYAAHDCGHAECCFSARYIHTRERAVLALARLARDTREAGCEYMALELVPPSVEGAVAAEWLAARGISPDALRGPGRRVVRCLPDLTVEEV